MGILFWCGTLVGPELQPYPLVLITSLKKSFRILLFIQTCLRSSIEIIFFGVSVHAIYCVQSMLIFLNPHKISYRSFSSGIWSQTTGFMGLVHWLPLISDAFTITTRPLPQDPTSKPSFFPSGTVLVTVNTASELGRNWFDWKG